VTVDGVDWRPWSAAVFERARAERKPVLLAIGAPWCTASLEMTRTTYADPEVRSLLAEHFVTIQVDADWHPDIAERYSLGGLPTTAFLDADGAIVGGGTFVPPDRMVAALSRTVAAFASAVEQPADGGRAAPDPPASGSHAPASDAELCAAVFDTYDVEHGGFGFEPKFPLVAPIELALAVYRESRDARMAQIAETTLDAMGWGELFDEVDGGFFRCASSSDWRLPRREKLLDVNASLLRIYVEAADALRITRYLERAAEILRYTQTCLADQADGGWAGSERAEDKSVDRTLYAGWNAQMASAALRASLAMKDTALGEFALRSLERVLLAGYRPGDGVAHCVDDGRAFVRGLLDDQVAMTSAQLDAHDATGNVVYEMMAQELMLYALRAMWDEERGGFFDRAVADDGERAGLLRQRLKPFVGNCDAARVLRRLAAVTGQPMFAERADAVLSALATQAPGQGPLAAHYLLARP
jgi:uncharacterized protein YyaL (SSP411 family)